MQDLASIRHFGPHFNSKYLLRCDLIPAVCAHLLNVSKILSSHDLNSNPSARKAWENLRLELIFSLKPQGPRQQMTSSRRLRTYRLVKTDLTSLVNIAIVWIVKINFYREARKGKREHYKISFIHPIHMDASTFIAFEQTSFIALHVHRG